MPSRWRRFGLFARAAVLGTLLVGAAFTVAHAATGWAGRAAGLDPTPLVTQVAGSVAGVWLLGGAVAAAAHLTRDRARVHGVGWLGPIVEAMERIAHGDFSVRLDDSAAEHQPFSTLVDSMNNMASQLDQMERLRQQFISDVSHEIQSPLTSIRGFARALQDDGLGIEERHHYLGIIEAESTRLSRTAADLLSMAALDSDSSTFRPAPYRLDRQIRDVVLASEPAWRAKGIEIEARLEEVTVTGDEDLLSQVWTNLLHNAVKFTPEGGHVFIALRQQGARALVEVTDTGIGIAKEDLDRIFERFYKADRARTGEAGGAGLGLSIAKRVVDLHSGTISVQSETGQGTTFSVSLPLEC